MGDLRSTNTPLEVQPLVNPAGQFIFSPLAKNVNDGLTHPDGTMTKEARARGYRSIEDIADSPAQAAELERGLKLAYMKRGGAKVPDQLMPKKVLEMRRSKKTVREPFGGTKPAATPE